VTGRRTYDAAIEVRIRLQELQAERAVARVAGLATNRAYMTDPAHRDGAAPTSPSPQAARRRGHDATQDERCGARDGSFRRPSRPLSLVTATARAA
jgi:hypothetical protein